MNNPEKCPNLIESCRAHCRKMRARGAIWIKDFDGRWHSDYVEDAEALYLSGFSDEAAILIEG